MKKRIIFLVAICLCMASCWSETNNPPRRTREANEIFQGVEATISRAVTIVDLADKSDIWMAASTTIEREKIEDRYFSEYKLRQRGDTILFVNREQSMLIITEGKRINDLNTSWRLLFMGDTLKISCVEDQTWHIQSGKNDFRNEQIDMKVTRQAYTQRYNISGQGCSYYSINTKSKRTYFRIEKSIEAINGEESTVLLNSNNISLMAGEIIFSKDRLDGAAADDIARAEIFASPHYAITYRGYTEKWPHFQYE